MRTNIVIDEKLLAEAIEATGAKTKREVVELGLAALVKLNKQKNLKSLRGKVEWTGDLEEMRNSAA